MLCLPLLLRFSFHGGVLGFNNPPVETIEWTPANGGDTNIRPHKLVEAGVDQVMFKIMLTVSLDTGVFLGIGVVPIFL